MKSPISQAAEVLKFSIIFQIDLIYNNYSTIIIIVIEKIPNFYIEAFGVF